ncbi:MAG TPA: hypothetical protein DDX54_04730 [Rhodospirillaceae bacterium]|nr:hypothetical protein [Alphaproteobacteria bacterium]HBH26686.1 hypothetical protein [Rhodospirillaceae bacterium]
MNREKIEEFILDTFLDVRPLDTWGERSFFVNPGQKLKRGTYFCTIKDKDGENDKSSNLYRPGIFRFNIGLKKETYHSILGPLPKRPGKGCVIEGDFDFAVIDKLLPHPVYAWMAWACILNPSQESFEACKCLMREAYKKAYTLTIHKIKNLEAKK